MLLQRSLAILQQNRQLFAESLRQKYSNEETSIPGHLVERLLERADEETSELIGQACGYYVPVLRLKGSLLERKNRHFLFRWKYDTLVLTDAVLESTPAAKTLPIFNPDANISSLIFTGSLSITDWTLITPLRSCAHLSINCPFDDEEFVKLGRSVLAQNRQLTWLDLWGSEVDLMAPRSRRNVMIVNLASEMRRWSLKLKYLRFESEHPLTRIIRVLVRQCPLLEELRVKLCASPADEESVKVEDHASLKRLVLSNNGHLTVQALLDCLPALTSLEELYVDGCPFVCFAQYHSVLSASLKRLYTDERIPPNHGYLFQIIRI